MSSVVISGDSSGSVTLSAPAVAGSNTIVLPSGSGTLTLPTGTATLTANGLNSNIVSGTSQASTSGTFIDFIGIPSWAKRITVMFIGVSTSGTSQIIIQIGNGSLETTGYSGQGAGVAGANVTSGGGTVTNGFPIDSTSAATSGSTRDGMATICLFTGSTYVFNSVVSASGSNYASMFGFSKTTSSVIDRIRITTAGGANTFDAGSVNILYE